MRNFINKHNRDYYGGALMMALGLGAIVQGLSYKVGTLARMGPGFFPVALGAILALTGAAIALNAKGAGPDEDEPYRQPEWRGWICILTSLVAFVVLGRYGGLLPASFAVVFISALGDRENTVMSALGLSLFICAISVAVFWWGLQMQFPLFRWG